MARNRFLSAKTAADIDQRVERVLRGLGNPEPPLKLEEVRELLKLDVGFYTADDPSIARQTISRIRVATIQVFKRPSLLKEAIEALSLKALYIPDQKRILLDAALPILKHRWNEAHEVGHSLLPWHAGMMFGDNSTTLSQHCHEHIEAEANFAAGRMLFLRDRFDIEARDSALCIDTVRRMKGGFGNTLSTTLYRFVETAGQDTPLVGMMSCHPHPERRPSDIQSKEAVRHFIRSPAFGQQFSAITETDLFTAIQSYCGAQRGGPLGQGALILEDDNGDRHRFVFETFFNRYEALTLGVYDAAQPALHQVGTF